jgi:hypothetical protein
MESPLLVGQETGGPLDNITKRLFFIFPLSKESITFLNRPLFPKTQLKILDLILQDKRTKDVYVLNYWSFTHFAYAFFFGSFGVGLIEYLIFHTLFELWELWAGNYQYFNLESEGRPLIPEEIIDILFDTLFAAMGIILSKRFLRKN